MNPEVKTKWLEELRSGRYAQGASYLKGGTDEGGVNYCCLGVLCEIAAAEGVVADINVDEYDGLTTFDGELTGLPLSVQEWAGLDRLGSFKLAGRDENLSDFNDSGTPFRLIADIIEDKL